MGSIEIECGFLNDLLVSVSISLLFTFLMCIQLKVILVKLLDDFQDDFHDQVHTQPLSECVDRYKWYVNTCPQSDVPQ